MIAFYGVIANAERGEGTEDQMRYPIHLAPSAEFRTYCDKSDVDRWRLRTGPLMGKTTLSSGRVIQLDSISRETDGNCA